MGFGDRFKKLLGQDKNEDEDFSSGENPGKTESEVNNNQNLKSSRNFKYLDNIIHSGVGEVVLDSDIVLDDGEELEYPNGIELDVNGIVIDGNGHVIDADGKTRMFRIFAKDVTIKNLSFKNGSSTTEAGAIYVCSDSGITMEDCCFEENCAEFGGGAIYNSSPLNFINCIFKANSSQKQGGAIYNWGSSHLSFSNCVFYDNSSGGGIYGHGGGAVFCEHKSLNPDFSILDFEGCKFIRNSSGGDGGAICLWESKIKLNGCIFDSNSSNPCGGAIYCIDGLFNLKNCDFNGNSCLHVGGGAIYASSMKMNSLEDCTFIENSSKSSGGGAIYCQKDSPLNVKNCNFFENSSKNDGAVIFNDEGDLKFNNCNFNHNNSCKSGGSIYNGGIVSLIDCNFKDNSANEDGADIYNRNRVNLHNSTFINNEDNRNMVFQADGEDNTLSIIGSTFDSSNDIIYIEDGFANVDNSKFNVSADGYGIFSNRALLTVVKSKFNAKKPIFCDYIVEIEENDEIEKQMEFGENFKEIRYIASEYPSDYKGFKYLDELISDSSGKIDLECDIRIHTAEKNFYEGGIELEGDLVINGNGHIIDGNGLSRMFIITSGEIVLKNIIFKNGKHFRNPHLDSLGGGAILTLPSSTLMIENCRFEDNESRQNAGAIHSRSKNLLISNSRFTNNSSQSSGGVILAKSSSKLIECEFVSNSSKWGGAICNLGFFECFDTCFDENSSQEGAGAIHNRNGNFSLKNSSFNKNRSVRGEGGAIYNDRGAFLVASDCKFIENCCELVDAGAIYNAGDLSCTKSGFDSNNAGHQGGAIGNGGSTDVFDCSFRQNSALFGGAIYNKWDLFKCRGCSFEDDSSKYGGNELHLIQKGSLELENCKFKNMDVYQDDETGPLTIIGCSFEEGGHIHSLGNIRISGNERGRYEDIIEGDCIIQYI